MKVADCGPVRLYDLEPEPETFRASVEHGLGQTPKTLSCKFFYDAAGAALFEQITALPEYYPTRLELDIMRSIVAHGSLRSLGSKVRVIEFGSGSGEKSRLLLEALDGPASYVPIDISRDLLVASAIRTQAGFPDVVVQPLCADFTSPFELPPEEVPSSCTIAYFPGSTIGNFTPTQGTDFLRMIGERVGPNGALILGVDNYPAAHHGNGDASQREKTVDDLWLAYNDSAGVTARFNRNLLVRMQDELGAEVEVRQFRHEAVFNEKSSRIEMYLVSATDQTIRIGERLFQFAAGEKILTEYSYKYGDLAPMVLPAGFAMHRAFSDPDGWFSVHELLRPEHRDAGSTVTHRR